MALVYVFNKVGKLVGPVESAVWNLSEEKWRSLLTPEKFRVLRKQGTEAAFCGMLYDNERCGVYVCAGCSLPLFSSDAKFDSGTGWPSFSRPIAAENIREKSDDGHRMQRVEVKCTRCDGHLGHVFPDGPRPTGLRFCLNSEAMIFAPDDQLAKLADPAAEI
ncbi:Peptide methionine sulfoxide reductase MsrB [Anatilimnocola aggregata]|uniref:Peptide methionine sulfoxide reductase MsrB n=1 Tax=Anatilimnocola aggregata TaxID=2528021 RepID=A0A517YAA8_9BACT|nr:peptide-methionine (R)-S-oxide reductase MsrB [Anatilimnocola aggregata]QDU27092.1 Peptide methionine sulfoxide reductase MsrB [Anatilimnocola aggregata]